MNVVLNREDPEWFWIVRSDGQEGFIPSGFVYPADNILQSNGKQTTNQNGYNALTNQQNNDTRQSQHPITDVNNESNACQNHNLPIGTAIGHVSIQNNNVINDQNILNANNTNSQVQAAQQQQQSIVGGSEDLRYHGTELVMLYDYKVYFVTHPFQTFISTTINKSPQGIECFDLPIAFRLKRPTICR